MYSLKKELDSNRCITDIGTCILTSNQKPYFNYHIEIQFLPRDNTDSSSLTKNCSVKLNLFHDYFEFTFSIYFQGNMKFYYIHLVLPI